MLTPKNNFDYINICKTGQLNSVQFVTKSSFFKVKEQIIIKVTDEKVIFRYPTIDYNGKTYFINRASQYGWMQMSFPKLLPLGKIYFDEESTEDEVILYLEKKL